MKLLIAVDGSEHAREAVAAASCFPLDSEVALVHTLDVSKTYMPFGMDVPLPVITTEEDLRHQGETILDHAAATLTSLGLAARKHLRIGFPAEEIEKFAEREKVDLIVMGARGLGSIEEIAFGSVSHHVLGHAPCPVLVVRGPLTHVSNALVPVETKEDVGILFRFLSRKAFRTPPDLEIVTALPAIHGLYDDADRTGLAYLRATEAMNGLAGDVGRLGYRIKTKVVWGGADQAIVREAVNSRADLIVIGSRRRSAVSRVLLGSVGHSILHRARCPVLVVREPAPEPISASRADERGVMHLAE